MKVKTAYFFECVYNKDERTFSLVFKDELKFMEIKTSIPQFFEIIRVIKHSEKKLLELVN